MKIATLALAIAGIVCAGAFGTGQALATTHHQSGSKTLNIVMHDPGCHWFSVHGKYTTTATVSASHVRLVDLDEAALKVVTRREVRHIPQGKSIVVGPGSYVIMMVGQAPDDNYLRLTVN